MKIALQSNYLKKRSRNSGSFSAIKEVVSHFLSLKQDTTFFFIFLILTLNYTYVYNNITKYDTNTVKQFSSCN